MKHTQHVSKQQRIRVVVCIAALLAFLAAALLLLHRLELKDDLRRTQTDDSYDDGSGLVRYQGKWYRQNSALQTVLLIGVDTFADQESSSSQQADFLTLLLIDPANQTYTALHLNRDTMANVPQLDIFGEVYGTKNEQLALAYAHADEDNVRCRNTVQAVSDLLYGVKIDHYIAVTMDAVSIFNDMVGGVTVHVEDDFSAVDASIPQGEDVTLFGEHALHFVRARSGMDEPTNLARMERQRVYLKALRQQAISCMQADDTFAMQALLDLAAYMNSDCNINQLANLLNTAITYDSPEIQTVSGESVVGEQFMEFYVDEDALQKQVIDLFFVEATDRN